VLQREVLGDLARYLAGLAGEGKPGKSGKPPARKPKPARATDRSQLSIFGE
jgi:hypothetical protein